MRMKWNSPVAGKVGSGASLVPMQPVPRPKPPRWAIAAAATSSSAATTSPIIRPVFLMEYSGSTISIILRGLHNEIYLKFRRRIFAAHSSAFSRYEGEDGGSAARSSGGRQRADQNRNAGRTEQGNRKWQDHV